MSGKLAGTGDPRRSDHLSSHGLRVDTFLGGRFQLDFARGIGGVRERCANRDQASPLFLDRERNAPRLIETG
jgi:hypothetical protein